MTSEGAVTLGYNDECDLGHRDTTSSEDRAVANPALWQFSGPVLCFLAPGPVSKSSHPQMLSPVDTPGLG